MNWKRTIGWALAGLLALLLIAIVGGYLYLRSNNFQQFALGKIAEQADQVTGGRDEFVAEFGDKTLSWPRTGFAKSADRSTGDIIRHTF